RPVKLVTTRDQGFTVATYRAETRHRIRMGATRAGKLTALLHEGWEVTSRADPYKVAGTDATARLYACPNVWTKVNLVRADRSPQPVSMRDGDWRVGWGCAMATYPAQMAPAAVRVQVSGEGKVRVQTAAHDVGTGAYTVIGQAAATRLGVPLANVVVELGDSS